MSSTEGSYAAVTGAWTECAASMARTKVKQALRDMAKKTPCRNRQPPISEKAPPSGSQPKVTYVRPSSFRESQSVSGALSQSSGAAFTQSHQNISTNADDVDERGTTLDCTPSCDAGVAGHSANHAKSPLFPIRLPPAHRTDLRTESPPRPAADINLYTVAREHQRPRPRSPVRLTRSEILRRYWVQEQRRESRSSCGLTDCEMTELLMDLQEEQRHPSNS